MGFIRSDGGNGSLKYAHTEAEERNIALSRELNKKAG